jgi:hypothetical protein
MTAHLPTIVRNPSDDPGFAAAVDGVLGQGITDIPSFVERLRKLYPLVLVRPRELAGEATVVWYVYRDGRWTSQRQPSPEG